MRRTICLLLFLALLLSGCGVRSAPPAPEPSPVPEPTASDSADFRNRTDAEEVDIDLTQLSRTMVYSEVYNMLVSPSDYIGKTVKMAGGFAVYHDKGTGKDYFSCIIRDAMACCAQGIEFVLAGEHVYPDDYPGIDDEICVVGVYDTYQEGERMYCTLRDAKLLNAHIGG